MKKYFSLVLLFCVTIAFYSCEEEKTTIEGSEMMMQVVFKDAYTKDVLTNVGFSVSRTELYNGEEAGSGTYNGYADKKGYWEERHPKYDMGKLGKRLINYGFSNFDKLNYNAGHAYIGNFINESEPSKRLIIELIPKN